MTKEEKFRIIQATNPAFDDYHTHIRKPEEGLTWHEAFEDSEPCYPDNENLTGNETVLTVYSSYPIKAGTFVSTSAIMAGEYAGYTYGQTGPRVHKKAIKIDQVAWISGDEGIFIY